MRHAFRHSFDGFNKCKPEEHASENNPVVPLGIWAGLASKLLSIQSASFSDVTGKWCSFHRFTFPFITVAPIVIFFFFFFNWMDLFRLDCSLDCSLSVRFLFSFFFSFFFPFFFLFSSWSHPHESRQIHSTEAWASNFYSQMFLTENMSFCLWARPLCAKGETEEISHFPSAAEMRWCLHNSFPLQTAFLSNSKWWLNL